MFKSLSKFIPIHYPRPRLWSLSFLPVTTATSSLPLPPPTLPFITVSEKGKRGCNVIVVFFCPSVVPLNCLVRALRLLTTLGSYQTYRCCWKNLVCTWWSRLFTPPSIGKVGEGRGASLMYTAKKSYAIFSLFADWLKPQYSKKAGFFIVLRSPNKLA